MKLFAVWTTCDVPEYAVEAKTMNDAIRKVLAHHNYPADTEYTTTKWFNGCTVHVGGDMFSFIEVTKL